CHSEPRRRRGTSRVSDETRPWGRSLATLGVTFYLPRCSQLHGVHQRIACTQIADNHHIVARRSQSRVAQIFLGYFDGGVRIIRKFYPHRIRPPTKRELASHFLAGSEGKNGGVFRTQIRGIAGHSAVPG